MFLKKEQLAEQRLAVQFGIEEATSYESFLYQFEEVNKKRNEMILCGEVVYGPRQYTLEQYYAYMNNNRKTALHKEIIRRGMVSEEEKMQYYETCKDMLYRKPDTYELEIYQLDQKKEKEWIEEIDINLENIRLYAKQYPQLLQGLKTCEAGECIELQDSNGQIYVIKCRKKITNGYFKQVEVQRNIEDRLARSKRDELVKEIIKEMGNGYVLNVRKYEDQG